MGDFSGESLALAISESGISKSELARRLGVTPQAVNDYIKKKPSLETWNKVYEAIGKQPLKNYTSIEDHIPAQVKEDEESYKKSTTDFNFVGQLKELSELFKAGALNEDEFSKAKEIVIKKFSEK